MTNKDVLWSICTDIYMEIYRRATPSADFRKILARAKKRKLKDNWFEKYYLHWKTQQAIINKHLKKHKLTPYEERKVSEEIWMGCGPMAFKEGDTYDGT